MSEIGVRPWGHYKVLMEDYTYKIKEITINAGQKLSLQYHQHRTEDWIIVKGKGIAIVNLEQITLSEGNHVQILPFQVHRAINDSTEPLVFIEVQRGSYLGEDDIRRLEDSYGRA